MNEWSGESERENGISVYKQHAVTSLSITLTVLPLPLSLTILKLVTFLLCHVFVRLSFCSADLQKESATLLSLPRGNETLGRTREMSRGNCVLSGGAEVRLR